MRAGLAAERRQTGVGPGVRVAAFKAAKADYPLALTFAAVGDDGSAPYVAEVQVEIANERGERVLSLPSVGPFLLARLQPGALRSNNPEFRGVDDRTHLIVFALEIDDAVMGHGLQGARQVAWLSARCRRQGRNGRRLGFGD